MLIYQAAQAPGLMEDL